MPNLTTNYSFNKPLVNDPVDEDLWGGQLNDNWDSVDSLLTELIPIGTILAYSGTSAPNSRWLLCDNSEVSRTTYADLFALVGTSYGVGDGATTFNLPDYRGRTIVGLDNLGGSSANRITDANADSLNNTGWGDETVAGSITINPVTLSTSNIPAHRHFVVSDVAGGGSVLSGSNQMIRNYNAGGSADNYDARGDATDATFGRSSSVGSGSSFTPTGSFNTSTGSNLQEGIASGVIIKALV